MSINDVKNQMVGLTGSTDALRMMRKTLQVAVAGGTDGAAAEAGWVGIPPNAAKVISVTISQPSAVASDGTSYVTMSLIKRDATGTVSATVATYVTSAVAIAAYAGHAMTLVPTNVSLEAGGSLSFVSAKTSGGVATGDGVCTVVYEEVGT
jgi:hypothetical protein